MNPPFDQPSATAQFRSIRPTFPRKLNLPLRIPPRTNNYFVVGTAFDYLLRFEIQRQFPHARIQRLVAEDAPEILWRKSETLSIGPDLLWEAAKNDPTRYFPPWEAADRAKEAIRSALDARAKYLTIKRPRRTDLIVLAHHTVRLAKLDSVPRVRQLGIDFEDVDPSDVEDLVDMLELTPIEAFDHEVLYLNPSFECQKTLGTSDADLIVGDLLVDIKVTKSDKVESNYLDQLLVYLTMSRQECSLIPTFPVIRRLGIYFCRHGHLWTIAAEKWTSNPQFAEVETWFVNTAKRVVSDRKAAFEKWKSENQ